MTSGAIDVAARDRRGPFASGPFRALFAARFIDVLGNGVAPIALAFAVLDLGGTAAQLGAVVATRAIANVAVLMFGGVLADRLPRGVVLLGTSVVAAITQGLIATLVLTQLATIPLLAVFSAVNGAAAAVSLPASSALTPQTVPAEALRSANALLRMGLNGGNVLGAAAGASMVALVGPGWGISIDALSFAVAGPLFLFARPPAAAAGRASRRTEASRSSSNILHELRIGWREFVGRSWVWTVVVQFMLVNAAFTGAVAVLGPVVADRTIGRSNWGLITAAETAGLVAGGIVALKWRPRHALRVGAALVGVTAIPIALLATVGALPIVVAVPLLAAGFFLGGIALEQFGIAWDQSLQTSIPPDRLARVYSYDALGSFAAIPLGELVVGPATDAFGQVSVLVTAAVVVLASSLAVLLVPSVRALTTVSSPMRGAAG